MHSYVESGPVRRAVRRTAATRPMARIYGRIQQPLDVWVHRATKGRRSATSLLADVELMWLTTTGARSGLPRTAPVLAVPDGDGYVVVASNFGRPSHPAWYLNLCATPSAVVVVGEVSRTVRSRELTGEERDLALARATEIYPGFENYRRWAAPRRLPVLRLGTES